MTDLEYLNLAEAALNTVESECDRLNETTDVDIDNQRTGGLLTLTLGGGGGQIVVNLQKPLQEIWLAARHGGFHFKWSGSQWIDTKDGTEFFALLSDAASEQTRMSLTFSSRQAG